MAGDDPVYRNRVAALSCCRCGAPPPSQVHHHTARRGFGQRASDRDAMPLCARCHESLHALSGTFRGYTKERLRQWQDMAVERVAQRAEVVVKT